MIDEAKEIERARRDFYREWRPGKTPDLSTKELDEDCRWYIEGVLTTKREAAASMKLVSKQCSIAVLDRDRAMTQLAEAKAEIAKHRDEADKYSDERDQIIRDFADMEEQKDEVETQLTEADGLFDLLFSGPRKLGVMSDGKVYEALALTEDFQTRYTAYLAKRKGGQ